MMPVVAGIGAVLAVILAIALWPKADDGDGKGRKRAKAESSAKSGADGDGKSALSGQAAGVAARTYDEPSAPGRGGKVNPAGAPVPDDTPPAFANVAEEIAWYEARLKRATANLESRKKFYERLPEVRERIAKGPDPQRQLEVFEGRKKIVEDNYTKAQADVAEIERKLKQLRG
jgi:hypothetical protein